MGQCLSCCEDDGHPTQNGHAHSSASAASTKSTLAPHLDSAPMTKYRPHALPMPVSGGGGVGGLNSGGNGAGAVVAAAMGSRSSLCSGSEQLEPLQGVPHGTRQPANGTDRKLFGPYTKLPPIRKPSATDSGGGPSGAGGGGGGAGGGAGLGFGLGASGGTTGLSVNIGSSGPNHGAKRTSFSSSLSLSREVSETKLSAFFDQYKDPDEDVILADGIERLCADLEVGPEEFRVLVLAWKFDAETMCKFTRGEFVNGCKKLRVDSIKGIQSRFPDLLEEVSGRQPFRDLYRWTYKFGLDTDAGQRTLPVDMAVSLWGLVFSQRPPLVLDRWLTFLENHPSIRGVPRDTWDMFLNFIEAVDGDLSSYDDTEAWPSLFDDFVESENDRQNQNFIPDKAARDFIG